MFKNFCWLKYGKRKLGVKGGGRESRFGREDAVVDEREAGALLGLGNDHKVAI